MRNFAQWLRRYPAFFDRLNRVNRRWRHASPIYTELAKHLPADKSFTFLQIGANDGISHDPYREFMIRTNARGVAVEPVPEIFTVMKCNYKAYPNVSPENCGIGYPAGRWPFYTYTPAFLKSRVDSTELAELASFYREKLSCLLTPNMEEQNECIQEIYIPVLTVEDIMIKHGFDRFDCLFVDCEGHEENILNQLDYSVVKPRLIVFEHTHFGERAEKIEAHLSVRGFVFTRLSHDTIASR